MKLESKSTQILDSKQFVAQEIDDFLPCFDRLQHFYGLCILECDDKRTPITLSESLRAENSLYFDRILFVVFGKFPESLVTDLADHFLAKNTQY